ncbi:MAG TPA: non-homologous end-joining DNA ligase [Kofleriaceae bacterium]|nr:non-homologous end-joining DNA ligase [Kofleriaceae bacterium]
MQWIPGVRLPKQLQLALLVDEAPDGDDWLHEQKFDGYRIVAELEGRRLRLLSRRFNDWTAQFPTVVGAVAALKVKSVLLDGEVAVVMPDGRTSFQALQNAFGRRDANLAYFVFDLLALDGEDLTKLPLEERKQRLAKLIGKRQGVLRYSDHVIGNGKAFFELACKKGLEGIVSKRRDAPYSPGRGKGWVKTKCLMRQELVIGGYTDPEGARTHIGALLVGYYEGGALRYGGKVGTGFTMKDLVKIKQALSPLEVATSPFEPAPPRAWTGPNRHWVSPTIVAEVAFSEWTNDGRLRHPSFQGLRADKPPNEIVREQATHVNR